MNTESPSNPQMIRYHAEIRRTLAPGTPLVILHVGEEQSTVFADTPGKTAATRILPIGSDRTAREYFRHDPPTPLEMEQAIAAVEEEVMPLRDMIAIGSVLYTAGAMSHETKLIGGASGDVLSIEQMEVLFNRLAAVSSGRPVVQEGLPRDGRFYATALILREFMHHLGFASITMRNGG